MASPTVHADENTQGSFTIPGWPSTCVVAITTAGMDRKGLGVDGLELGSLSDDSQEYFGDLTHAGKTSYLRSQLNTVEFKLLKR